MFIRDLDSLDKNASHWPRPVRENNEFWSERSRLVDKLWFQPKLLVPRCPSGQCVAIISIYCIVFYCDYTITAV